MYKSIAFTDGTIEEIQKLTPIEMKAYFKIYNFIGLSKSEICDEVDISLIGVIKVLRSLLHRGLIKELDNSYTISNYFDHETPVMHWGPTYSHLLLKRLSAYEVALLFRFNLDSINGEISYTTSEFATLQGNPLIHSWRVKKAVKRLTAKGFLSPIKLTEGLYRATLFNGQGKVWSKER